MPPHLPYKMLCSIESTLEGSHLAMAVRLPFRAALHKTSNKTILSQIRKRVKINFLRQLIRGFHTPPGQTFKTSALWFSGVPWSNL